MVSILREEKVYENEVKSGFFNSTPAIKKVENASNLRKDKLRIDLKGLYFGAQKLFIIFAMTLSLTIIAQYLYYMVLIPKAERVGNMIRVYTAGAETWCSLANLHHFFFHLVYYNNTVRIWGTDSLEAVKGMRNHFLENVHANLSRSTGYDLGNYTEKFRNILTKVRSDMNKY